MDTNYKRLKNQLEDIQNNIQNLEIKNGKYEFLLENIQGTVLTADIKQNLPYNREGTISKLICEMEDFTKNLETHKAIVDSERNQFIQYLYTYLSTLADEMRTIPKNTKVKIGDDWKEIFQIQVPSWEEEEGKEEIRKYVDWMISKLEKEEFLDEEGKEDQGKIKKSYKKLAPI